MIYFCCTHQYKRRVPNGSEKPKHPKLNHLANLPDHLIITNIVRHDNCDELYITFDPLEPRVCPHCGSINCVIKDAGRTQTVRHTANAQRGTIVTFHKRRLYCKDCSSSFLANPEWVHPALHITNALYITILLDLTQTLSITTIVSKNRVTSSIVASVLDTIVWKNPSRLPETLCVDEFKGRSGEWNPEKSRWDVNKYYCNISDGDAGVIIDILVKITAEFLMKYFRQFVPAQRKRVKYYCCDMHNGFISVAKDLFPDAYICIDMFHVIKLINDTIELIRRRL
jgi:transposase